MRVPLPPRPRNVGAARPASGEGLGTALSQRLPVAASTLLAVALCLLPSPSRAASRTWTGASSGLWSEPANWGGSPVSAGDELHFPEGAAHTAMTNDLGAAFPVASLRIEASSTTYSLAGDSIALGTGGISVAAFSGNPAHSIGAPIVLGAGAAVVDLSGALTISGLVSGEGGMTKTGAGTLTLTAANSYSGTTTINGGLVLVNGSQPTSPVVVDQPLSGGGLWGIGTVGPVVVTSGFINPPSGRLGVLTVAGSVTLGPSAGMYPVIVNPAVGTGCPQLSVTGAIALGSAFLYPSLNPSSTTGSVYTIIQAAGGVTGTFASKPDGSTFYVNGRTLRIDYLATSVTLTDVGPQPVVATVSGGGAICAGQSVSIQAALTGWQPWSVTWSDGFTQTDIYSSPATRSVSPPVTTEYTVTAVSDAHGTGTSTGSAIVTVNPVPAAPVVVAPSEVGAGSPNRPASVTASAGSTYAWTVGNGTLTSGQGTGRITFTAGSPGTLSLSVVETTASGCSSGTGNATVTVNPAGMGVAVYTLLPCRIIDTRNADGPLGGPALSPGLARTFVVGTACGVPASATSVLANLTVTGASAPGFLTLYPGGSAPPLASTVNFSPGQTRANNAVLRLASDGSGALSVLNGSTGPVHLILDVNGYIE